MKTLYWDIETSHMLTLVFSLYPDYIPPDNIVKDWKIFCISYKWKGDKTYTELKGNEKTILTKISKVLSNADVIVFHNGDKFDLPKLRTRIIKHGLPPLLPFNRQNSRDTLKLARKYFKFSSNRLDYLGEFLGVGRKISVPKGLWKTALLGKPKDRKAAIDIMSKYCGGDVLLLEKVDNALLEHANTETLSKIRERVEGDYHCDDCNKGPVYRRCRRNVSLGIYWRYRCEACEKWTRGPLIRL